MEARRKEARRDYQSATRNRAECRHDDTISFFGFDAHLRDIIAGFAGALLFLSLGPLMALMKAVLGL